MKMETKKVWFFAIVFVLGMVSIVCADSTSYMADVMKYVKWIVSSIAGIVTLSAVGFLMWGMHLRQSGDMKGDQMVKNALWTIVVCAIAWALIGAFLYKGSEINTGVTGITEGWK